MNDINAKNTYVEF